MTTSPHMQSLYERALKVLPGGVSRNAVLNKPHPCYVAHAAGCRVTDVDGAERIDFSNNMTSLIHGHAHPKIIEAVNAQIRRGTGFSLATEVEIEYAEALAARCEGFHRIRFVNSGSEAVICCIKAARAYTGRPMIAKVEGAYHGIYDYAEISQNVTPNTWGDPCRPAGVPVCRGTPASAVAEVVVIPFNDCDRARAILDSRASDIACVLIDPMPHRVGLVPASPVFVSALHDWTRRRGALLVFDEVITFRSEFRGAQQWFGLSPDLTALGKIIGGGFPVGAIAGRADVMEVLNPLLPTVPFPHSGTFSANPVTMTAGLTAMSLFDGEAVARLNALGQHARTRLSNVIRELGIQACVTGAGSLFRIHFKAQPPPNYRAAFPTPAEVAARDALLNHLFDHGFILINTCCGALSTAMSVREIDQLTEAVAVGLRAVQPMLDRPASN